MSAYEAAQLIVLLLLAAFYLLSRAAARRPDIEWLRAFRWPALSPEIQARNRRRAERMAGIEFILLGVALPIGYMMLTAMTFSSLDPWWTFGVAVASVACLALGITAIVKNRA